MVSRWSLFFAFWLVHVVASIAAFLWHYKVSANQFDGYAVSTLALRLSLLTNDILWFPLAKPIYLFLRIPAWMGWLPVLVNSAIWVIAFRLILRWYRRNQAKSKIKRLE